MLTLEKFSLGVGDRFAHQAKAQLQACVMAAGHGVTVIPVWNKSNREHGIVGSEPASVRAAADAGRRGSSAGNSPTTWTPTTSTSAPWTASSTPATSTRSTSPPPSASPPTPRIVDAFVERHPELQRHRDHPRHRRSPSPSRAMPSPRIAASIWPPCSRPAPSTATSHAKRGAPRVHHRGLDGRDRLPRRRRPNCWSSWPPSPTRRSPSRPSRRSSPAASTRAWITWATWCSSRRSSATTWP